MKYLIFVLLSVVGTFAVAQESKCQDKLDALKDNGVDPKAFEQALKNRGSNFPSRYVLMAELGPKREGEMHLVDTQTGEVRHFKMWHGDPENLKANTYREETTFFGGSHLIVDSADHDKNHRIQTKPYSSTLISKLNGSDSRPGLNQQILHCSKKFRENPNRDKNTMNDLCLEPKDVMTIQKLLAAERQPQAGEITTVLFTYPKEGLDKYLKTAGAHSNPPDVCGALKFQLSTLPPKRPADMGAGTRR